MSYNLRYDNPRDGENRWSNRTDAVKAVWNKIDADIVGIQEGLIQMVRFLEDEFPQYERYGIGRKGGEEGEHQAVFYKKDKFRRIDQGQFWLSDTPDVVASKTWGNKVIRMATWVRLVDRDDAEWLVLNTHLDHVHEGARVNGAELIRRFLKEAKPADHVIITGDFNATPESEPLKVFLGDGVFSDALKIAGDERLTYHEFNDEGISRIDYILTDSTLVVEEGSVVTLKTNGQYPSDHWPVFARLSKKAKG